MAPKGLERAHCGCGLESNGLRVRLLVQKTSVKARGVFPRRRGLSLPSTRPARMNRAARLKAPSEIVAGEGAGRARGNRVFAARG